jgi:hypothetical protein
MIGLRGVREHYFVTLLKIRAVAGAARNSQIVTYRLVQPGETGN